MFKIHVRDLGGDYLRGLCVSILSRFVAEDHPWHSRSATFIVTVQICHCVNGQCDVTQLHPARVNGSDVYKHVMCDCDVGWIGMLLLLQHAYMYS